MISHRPPHDTNPGVPSLSLVFAAGRAGPSPRLVLGPVGLVLGRDLGPLCRPLDDPHLAARHAEVRPEGGTYTLRDLGTKGGTRLNGERLIGEHTLVPGDVLRMGDTLFVYAEHPVPTTPMEPTLAGASGQIAAVVRSMHAVASRMHTVVITGETGTGKEVVAQRIHDLSGRTGAFVAVNCAVCSEPLLATELFGHVRGAFTGAVADQPGLFRAARGGTLLLDEMADMPLSLQAMLLRVLETRSVRPVGSSRDVPIDTRVLVTTNREIVGLVQSGLFRADLYARLSQWTIRVPPLRSRREDIGAITAQLLPRCGGAGRDLAPDLAEELLLHDWPLNIRGLLNTLSIATITTPGSAPLELTEEVASALTWARSMRAPQQPTAREMQPTRVNLEELLTRFGGRVAPAARHLGITRTRLYRLLATHSIVPEDFRPHPAPVLLLEA